MNIRVYLPSLVNAKNILNIALPNQMRYILSPLSKSGEGVGGGVVVPHSTENRYKPSSSGFTLPEMLIVILLIGILATLGIVNWLAFVETHRLNTAQDEVNLAMHQAQRQATKNKLTWQASFREQNSIVQWAVHPATVNPSAANWNNLDSNVRLDDEETTLPESNGIKQIQFDYKGNVSKPPLGRITLSSKSGGKVKRCVIVSTILGAKRMGKDHATPKDNKYCY